MPVAAAVAVTMAVAVAVAVAVAEDRGDMGGREAAWEAHLLLFALGEVFDCLPKFGVERNLGTELRNCRNNVVIGIS